MKQVFRKELLFREACIVELLFGQISLPLITIKKNNNNKKDLAHVLHFKP